MLSFIDRIGRPMTRLAVMMITLSATWLIIRLGNITVDAIEIALGRWARGAWVGDWQFWFPHVIGFAAVAMGIPYVAKIAIPTFVSLRWDADPTAKAWALGIAVAVSIVVGA